MPAAVAGEDNYILSRDPDAGPVEAGVNRVLSLARGPTPTTPAYRAWTARSSTKANRPKAWVT
jgi:hypothetical protein